MMAGFTRPQARFPPATTKVNSGSGDPKVSKGRSESPLVAPAGAKPLLVQKSSFGCKTSYMVAPIWRDTAQMLERAAWGRFCGSAKLLAGTLRCLHLCWRLPWDWSDSEQLGRCPKPHKGRCPLPLQGADEKGRSPPPDPFSRLGWSRFHAPSACSFRGLRLSPYLLPQLSVKNQKSGARCITNAAEQGTILF